MFLIDLDCKEPVEVLSSSDLESSTAGKNILEPCNNNHWRAPLGKTGEEAEIVIDIKCPLRLETFSIMNGFGDFGTQKFSLFGSRKAEGPWKELYKGDIPQGEEMTKEVKFF